MDDEIKAALKTAQRETQGEYPNGRLNEHDHGAGVMAIYVEGACVRIDFAQPTNWFAMTPGEAISLAGVIVKHARKAAGVSDE